MKLIEYGENSCQGMFLTSPEQPEGTAKGCALF